jgi:hypothetical protein
MAQKIALFVSEEKLKHFTSVNQNVSPLDLVPYILQAQDVYLQNYIGATFYFQLKDQVLNGTVDSNNQFILDNYIGPALCNWGLMQALPWLKYKIFNKSVLSPTSENADSIELEELKFLQEQLRSTAETYSKRLIEWMVLHPGNYPKYITPNVLDGQLPDRGNPYYTSLVTPHQPYAFKKRLAYTQRDLANVGYYDNGYNCLECGPNTYVSNTVY